MGTFETKMTTTMICPYCGHKDKGGAICVPGAVTCESCNRTFVMERSAEICYTTRKY